MNTLIVYMTSHGCAEKSAMILKDLLGGEVSICNLKNDKVPLLGPFDNVIVGGSIHASRVQKKVKEFCNVNEGILLEKKLGLYLCHMEEGEKALKQFEDAYPENLRKKAVAHGLFGGAFDFDKMNFFEKVIVKKVAKVTESISRLDESKIQDFAKNFA
jgi:menaquinone-dependent protoporphyrinogen oxidase